TAKWGVQIAGMIFQTRSSAKVRSNSRQKHFSASVGCFFTSIPSFSPAFMFFFSYQPHSFLY
ncbi:MAG: DUF6783 domain-containing protein, partial [Ruminococcus sp.]